MKKHALLIFLIFATILSSCSSAKKQESNSPQYAGAGYQEINNGSSNENATTTESLTPFYTDENGVLYDLIEGSNGEYEINPEHEDWLDTPNSSAISRIGYWPYGKTLWIEFRNTNALYAYYNVSSQTWGDFKKAESIGSFFHEFIKGIYEYEKVS